MTLFTNTGMNVNTNIKYTGYTIIEKYIKDFYFVYNNFVIFWFIPVNISTVLSLCLNYTPSPVLNQYFWGPWAYAYVLIPPYLILLGTLSISIRSYPLLLGTLSISIRPYPLLFCTLEHIYPSYTPTLLGTMSISIRPHSSLPSTISRPWVYPSVLPSTIVDPEHEI